MVGPMRKSLLSKAVTAVCATVMCLGVTACGGNSSAKSDKSNSDSSSSSEKIGMHQIAGVTAKGELGKKPTVSFKTPMTVEDNSYVVLQKGDGAQIEDGDRVCSQGIAISVKDGSELASTWEKNPPNCSTVVTSDTSQMTENYYKIFKSLKLNSTVAFGVNDSNSSGTSYLMVLTLVSKSKDLKKATGEKVAGVPADLPKVTLAKDGKPSIAEYYEMTEEMATARKANGDLLYGFGVILNYVFSEKRLEEIADAHMPIHVVEKKIPYMDESGSLVKPDAPNGYKFETLVLDMVHMMADCVPYEVDRKREFAPIKNLHGVDSLDSARELMQGCGIEL